MAIDCGSATKYTTSGIVYSADTDFSGGSALTVTGNPTFVGLGLTSPNLFKRYRSGACTYTIPLANGTYVVALQFCETTSTFGIGSRKFNVDIQGTRVLSNYDIMLYDTTLYTPIYQTFNATVNGAGGTGSLTIQLSNGSASVPVISAILVRTIPTLPTKISPGEYTTFMINNGTLLANGSNRAGEAGLDVNVIGNLSYPASTVPISAGVSLTDVAPGGYFGTGLDTNGNVWEWGSNLWGQLGNGTSDTGYHLPQQVMTDSTGATFNNIKAFDAGFNYTVALKNDGTVWVWGLSGIDTVDSGYDSTGLIGNGDQTSQNLTRPHKVVFPAGVVISKISAGMDYILALDNTGGVWSWGGADAIQDRGNGNSNPSTPTKLTFPAGVGTITQLAAGWGFSYVLDSNKNLYGWGFYGSYLGLGGPGDTDHRISAPIAISTVGFATGNLTGHVAYVRVSQTATHVIRDDGTLWCWGDAAVGSVGNGSMLDWTQTNPVYAWSWSPFGDMVWDPVQVLSNVSKLYTCCQSQDVYAIKTDGTIWTWGRGKGGFLANGVVPGPANFVASEPEHWDVPVPAQVQPY